MNLDYMVALRSVFAKLKHCSIIPVYLLFQQMHTSVHISTYSELAC